MKWYNYKHIWVNIENICYITLEEPYKDNTCQIWFHCGDGHTNILNIAFYTLEERDAEFAKIKELMGVKDYQSRCC